MSILQVFLIAMIVPALAIKFSDHESAKCVDKMKQPAFQSSLLKHHKFQESPSEIPRSIVKTKSKRETREAQVSTVNCPQGTIPVRDDQVTMVYGTQPDADYTPGHEYAIASTSHPSKLYGTKATINVWNPKVEGGVDEVSISQIWVTSGDYRTNDLNSIEVGWQVYPKLYWDSKPRLFIFWTSDSYKKTGCYNLWCPGFIQTSSSIVLGGPITPVSIFEGNQYELSVSVWKDRKSGNWWLSVGPNNTLVGYWPAEIFTTLADHATYINWGGEVTNSWTFGRHTKTQMGSGQFSEKGFGEASYFRNLEIVDNNNSLQSVKYLETDQAYQEFYDIKTLSNDDWGSHFYYGGPGFKDTHSKGALSSRMCLSLVLVYLLLICCVQ